jgi:hypothetical protein
LPHDQFQEHASDINRLLGIRNGISHGSSKDGIAEKQNEQLKSATFAIMSGLGAGIMKALSDEAYLRADRKHKMQIPQASQRLLFWTARNVIDQAINLANSERCLVLQATGLIAWSEDLRTTGILRKIETFHGTINIPWPRRLIFAPLWR